MTTAAAGATPGKGGTAGASGASGASGTGRRRGPADRAERRGGPSFGGSSGACVVPRADPRAPRRRAPGGVELVNKEGWVGGDPAIATDNPLGIQGAWYAYGDEARAARSRRTSIRARAASAASTARRCVDATFAAWGCGIGLELNSSGDTDAGPSVKRAFAGTASTFTATISGNTGGNPIRINFTQQANTASKVSPYRRSLRSRRP